MIQDTSRDSVNVLMKAVGLVDLLIPRGGPGLINACVPECPGALHPDWYRHLPYYVDESADQDMALNIIETPKPAAPPSATPRRCCWCTGDCRRISAQAAVPSGAGPGAAGLAAGGIAL